MNWYAIPEWDIAIGAMQKCGTRSILFSIIKHFLPETRYEDMPALLANGCPFFEKCDDTDYSKVGIVREPVARFASLWRSKFNDETPEHLFGRVKRMQGDPHFARQTTMLMKADSLVRLENLSEWWGKNTPAKLHLKNSTEGGDEFITQSLRVKILKFYATDRQLWERAG